MNRKVVLVLIMIISLLSLKAEDLFKVTLIDGSVFRCRILEHKPGESILIEDSVSGSLRAFKDSEIYIIERIINKKSDSAEEENKQGYEVNNLDDSYVPEILSNNKGYDKNSLLSICKDRPYRSLKPSLFDSSILNSTDLSIRTEVYSDLYKSDYLKYTAMNIAPGVGSIKQGDYLSAAYTIVSVLGALVYNLNDGFGTDYALAVNLNMCLAYGASFFAPYNYEREYNKKLRSILIN